MNPLTLPRVAAISVTIRRFLSLSTGSLLNKPLGWRFKLRAPVNFDESRRSTSYIESLWEEQQGVGKERRVRSGSHLQKVTDWAVRRVRVGCYFYSFLYKRTCPWVCPTVPVIFVPIAVLLLVLSRGRGLGMCWTEANSLCQKLSLIPLIRSLLSPPTSVLEVPTVCRVLLLLFLEPLRARSVPIS